MDRDEARTEALERLLTCSGDLPSLTRDPRDYPWDSEHVLAVLTPEKASNLLSRYLSGELNSAQVEGWADAIEVREDIGFPPIVLLASMRQERGRAHELST